MHTSESLCICSYFNFCVVLTNIANFEIGKKVLFINEMNEYSIIEHEQ